MNILYLENHPHFAKAVISEFLHGYTVIVCPRISQAKDLAANGNFDVALVDYDLDVMACVSFDVAVALYIVYRVRTARASYA